MGDDDTSRNWLPTFKSSLVSRDESSSSKLFIRLAFSFERQIDYVTMAAALHRCSTTIFGHFRYTFFMNTHLTI